MPSGMLVEVDNLLDAAMEMMDGEDWVHEVKCRKCQTPIELKGTKVLERGVIGWELYETRETVCPDCGEVDKATVYMNVDVVGVCGSITNRNGRT